MAHDNRANFSLIIIDKVGITCITQVKDHTINFPLIHPGVIIEIPITEIHGIGVTSQMLSRIINRTIGLLVIIMSGEVTIIINDQIILISEMIIVTIPANGTTAKQILSHLPARIIAIKIKANITSEKVDGTRAKKSLISNRITAISSTLATILHSKLPSTKVQLYLTLGTIRFKMVPLHHPRL